MVAKAEKKLEDMVTTDGVTFLQGAYETSVKEMEEGTFEGEERVAIRKFDLFCMSYAFKTLLDTMVNMREHIEKMIEEDGTS